ncbi:MAG: hypothetical protein WC836_02960 [Desulfobacula sp.]
MGFFIYESPLYDETTLLLSVGMGISLLIGVKLSRKYLFDQLAMITLSFLIFVFPRLLMYLVAPEYVEFPFGDNIDANTVNVGLFYVLTGFVFFLSGMMIANPFIMTNLRTFSIVSENLRAYSNKNLLMLFLFTMAIQLYSSLNLGISPYGKMQTDSFNVLFQGIRTVLEVDSCFVFVLAALLLKNFLSGTNRKSAIIFIVLVYIAMTVLGGSRAGTMRVIMSLAVIVIILYGNARIKIIKLINILLLLITLSLAVFPLATFSRLMIIGSHREDNSPIEFATEETQNLVEIKGLIARVCNRMGTIDYPILIATQEGDKAAQSKFHAIQYPIKNIINMLLPGTPFPENAIMTSRAIDIIYRGGPETDMYERYNSEFWTLWGITYIYFGWFGGILAMFCTGFICHMLYGIIVTHLPGLQKFYLRLWFLYYAMNGIIWNMGIDSAVTAIFQGLLQFAFLSGCIYFLNYISLIFNRFTKKTAISIIQ